MIIRLILLKIIFCFSYNCIGQTKFSRIKGIKANYSLEIPSSFIENPRIGKNIDLKYTDEIGASIVTLVKKLPSGTKDSDITQVGYLTDEQTIQILESNGLQSINLIKKGYIIVDGILTFFSYYHDNDFYYHSIIQFRKGNLINVIFTCDYEKKIIYMPYVNKVINSVKYKTAYNIGFCAS